MDDEENLVDVFLSPDSTSDLTLIVEDKKLFAHKSILGKSFSSVLIDSNRLDKKKSICLGQVSPVFSRMFYSTGFRESKSNEISLPGKEYSHILELLKVLYPNILKPIDQSNVLFLLPLADEYSILILKRNIEKYLISSVHSMSYKYGDSFKRLCELISLAQLYRLNRLEENLCEHLTTHFSFQQWNRNEFSSEFRCHLFELFVAKQEEKLKEKQMKLKQLEDSNLKQKFEIQRLKSQLENKSNEEINSS